MRYPGQTASRLHNRSDKNKSNRARFQIFNKSGLVININFFETITDLPISHC